MCDMTGSIIGGIDVIPPDLLAKGNGWIWKSLCSIW